MFWNGLHVCLQIAAVVVCIETPASRVYWPWMAVVASIITMISAGRVFFGYLNLHRAAQWDIYYSFSHTVRVRFPKVQIEWRKDWVGSCSGMAGEMDHKSYFHIIYPGTGQRHGDFDDVTVVGSRLHPAEVSVVVVDDGK